MADDPEIPLQERRLLRALTSADSYGLVLLLILVTYALSTHSRSESPVQGDVGSPHRSHGLRNEKRS